MGIREILYGTDKEQIRALFEFKLSEDTDDEIVLKFNLFVRYFFPLQFKHKDAPFHDELDHNNLKVYRGEKDAFIDIVYRGGAKTTRTKLFIAFFLLNDRNHFRKFVKVLTKNVANAKQVVTDIYNILINHKVVLFYPELFEKSNKKVAETMGNFIIPTYGIRVLAGTVGVDQRGDGHGEEETARPDFVWFDDFETRKTLRSATETKALWDNMEEARTGLSTTGGCIYTCNYLSERGNVHKLITQAKSNPDYILMIIPIIKDGVPTWDLYTVEDIDKMRATDDDFAGEKLCEPSAGMDVMFDRQTLKNQHTREPRKEFAGFKMFYEYNPAHRYGMGADIAGGVGLDSSADVIIDFSTIPARVVATYANNTIKPDTYGDELERHARMFGEPIIAPENNKFDMCIGRLKQVYRNIYYTQPKDSTTGDVVRRDSARTYGWNTNRLTKPKMIFDLKKAVEDGLLELTDENLVAELMSYTRDDLMDTEIDPRLTTRHFDLLMAACIAWAMKDWATVVKKKVVHRSKPKNPDIYD